MTLPPSVRVIRGDDTRRMPWRNGLGSTREIVREPDTDNWLWRLSIADITQDAAFSTFPEIDRILLLLSGNGVELCFDDDEHILLDGPGQMHWFAGDRPLSAHVVGGPTTDLNLMWRRKALTADLWLHDLTDPLTLEATTGQTWLVHVTTGRVDIGGVALPLAAGDTWIAGAATSPWTMLVRGTGTAVIARLRQHTDT